MPNHHPQAGWWGKFSVTLGQTFLWEIGPLKLAVQRLVNEWQIAYEQDDAQIEEFNGWRQDAAVVDFDPSDYANVERYTFNKTETALRILPALADRSVVVRPQTPFYVAAGEETAMFVSTPLWIRVEVGNPPQLLQEIPIRRPSDTWLGPSTMVGELCYASRTHGRLNFENLPHQSYRAITQVIIGNQSGTTLPVERLSLPVPYLSLFASADGLLWTEVVTMTSTRETGMATFDIKTAPPEQAGQTKKIGEPRQQSTHRMVIRAFGALFG